jgi:hypothetical protein
VGGLAIAPVLGHTSTIMRRFPHAWRRGREAEGGGLLNRYRVITPYRGFESLRLRQCRQIAISRMGRQWPRRRGQGRCYQRRSEPTTKC